MLDEVTFPFYPSAVNGMTWSKDGELAIAAGEHVYILCPKLRSSPDQAQPRPFNESQWDVVRLRVNVFTNDEVALSEPTDSSILSLGEEQSTSTIVSLVWSPPGLGKHRRSVLAILTSNHVLSVWESRSRPNEGRSWNRSLVINNDLAGFSQRLDDLTEQGKAQQDYVARLRRRIRAFSWSYPCCPQSSSASEARCDAWGVPILALTNDNNEIILFQLHSPHYPFLPPNKKWKIEALAHFKISESSIVRPQASSLLASAFQSVKYVSHVAWSPWIQRADGSVQAVLAYLSDGRLLFRKIRVQIRVEQMASLSVDQGESEYAPDTGFNRLTGPLVSHKKVYKDGVLFAVATDGSIVTIFVRNDGSGTDQDAMPTPTSASWSVPGIAREAEVPQCTVTESRLSREVRWDRISCINLANDITQAGVYLHIISHLTHTESLKYALKDGKASVERLTVSLLGDELAESRYQYDMENDLGDSTVSRFGGSSLSPTGGHMATLFSLHAGDMLEYVTVAREKSIIRFSAISDVTDRWITTIDNILESLQDATVSAEALVFQLLHDNPKATDNPRGDNTHDIGDTKNPVFNNLRQALDRNCEPEMMEHENNSTAGDDIITQSALSSRLRKEVMLSKRSMAMRLKRILDHTASLESQSLSLDIVPSATVLTDMDSDPFARSSIIRLVGFILQSPKQWASHSALSKRIKYTAACVATLGLGYSKERLNLANETFDWLATHGGMDLIEEREHLAWLRDSESKVSAFEYYAAHRHSHTLLSKSKDDVLASAAQDISEVCEMCGAGVGWNSLTQAQCHSGHTFKRCALTFLAIQAPGISKYCGLCGIGYLHQDFLLKDDVQYSASAEERNGSHFGALSATGEEAGVAVDDAPDTDNTETPQSLVQILFASCEVCIFCGGKFVG